MLLKTSKTEAPLCVHVCPAATRALAAAEINGIRVTRKGKGAPPADAQEQLWATRGKREVPGRSRATK